MSLFVPALILASSLGYLGVKKFKESKEPKLMVKSSLLFAFLTKGNMLVRADRGKVNGMFYDMYITLGAGPLFGEPIAPGGSVIYRLELPFSTQGHLVGISNKEHNTKQASIEFVKESGLSEVVLEGDFINYFKLFCPEGQKTHARYIFDPAAMQFVVDFCSEHDWEIVYDELYFTVAEDQKGDAIIQKSIKFLEEIKPAVIREFPSKEAIKRKTPYGEWRGDPMPCPICQTNLEYKVHWHECPGGHGRLLHAQKLLGFRKGQIKNLPEIKNLQIHQRQTSLVCPHCANKMIEMQYAQRGLMIDSCPKCPYRWFDAGELEKITIS
jgi:hypothetical protein